MAPLTASTQLPQPTAHSKNELVYEMAEGCYVRLIRTDCDKPVYSVSQVTPARKLLGQIELIQDQWFINYLGNALLENHIKADTWEQAVDMLIAETTEQKRKRRVAELKAA